MSDHLFDEAFDEFERELDPIDNRLDEALEEFEDDLEVGGGFYDEENDDGYFHSATKNEEAVVINRTSVPKTNNVDSNVYKGNGLSAKSGDNDANSQHGKLITTSQEETSIDLNQDSVGANMWNQKARLLKRHERKHKRHIHRERKHRIFEMAKGQAIEMKTKLVEASAEDTEAPFLELNMLSVEVSSALSTVQEIEKRRQDLKQRLSEVHRASRLRRPRSADVRPSALMAAVGTPRGEVEDGYAADLTRQLEESLPILSEARQVLEALQSERSKKLALQSSLSNLPLPPPHGSDSYSSVDVAPVDVRTPLVAERDHRKPRRLTSEVSLLSMLGIHSDDSKPKKPNDPPRPPTIGSGQITKKPTSSVSRFDWSQLAEDRCLTPAHELAKLKARETITSQGVKKSGKKVAFESPVRERPTRELESDLHILWKQSPMSLLLQDDVSESASAELQHESHVYEVFESENASEAVRMLMMSLKDCGSLKDFAIASHAFERCWGGPRREQCAKQRAFIDAHELICHLCAGVRFSHVVYLPAVLATLDTFCIIKQHRLAVLKDGCVNAVLSRMNSGSRNQSNPFHKALQHYGQRLICSLLWREDLSSLPAQPLTLIEDRQDAITLEENNVHRTHVREETVEKVTPPIKEEIVTLAQPNRIALGIIDESEVIEAQLFPDNTTIGNQGEIVGGWVGLIEPNKGDRPELVEADQQVADKESATVLLPPKQKRSDKKTRRKREEKVTGDGGGDVIIGHMPETVITDTATLSASELRVLRKKERRSKQRPSLKTSLPRS